MKKRIEVLEMIAEDMKADAEYFDGKPFTGKTVGIALGHHGAAIAALANIIKAILKEIKNDKTKVLP